MQGTNRLIARAALAGVAACVAGGAATPAAAGTTPPLEAVEIESLDTPTYTDDAPGFPDLLFVTEKGGVVRVLENEDAAAEPFLDISDLVTDSGEEGLLSIAFPPDYAETRRFYVYFVNRNCSPSTDGCNIEVDEFKRSRTDPLRAREASRRQVIEIPHQDAANHNGGTVRVDADGKLWLATGDGGGGGDTFDNARDTHRLLGKLLRVKPVRAEPHAPGYRIPHHNPYVGEPGRDEIFSYGLRNPFRFTIDDELGAVEIADVGQGQREEVDLVSKHLAKGANFGWPQWEGDIVYDQLRPGADPPTPPSYAYLNPPDGLAAVTGGLVVRDPGLPSLQGRYLFADFFAGELVSMLPTLPSGPATDGRDEGVPITNPVAFTEGAGGQLYVTSLNGPVYRLEAVAP